MTNLSIKVKQKGTKRTVDLSEYCQLIVIENNRIVFCVEMKNPLNNLAKITEFNNKLGNIGKIITGGKFMEFDLLLSHIEVMRIN